MIIYTDTDNDSIIKERVLIQNPTDNSIIAKGFVIIDYKEEGKPAGTIENIWTHPDHRFLGYGKQVVTKLIELAKDRGCYKVTLICDASNIEFYNKCGLHEHQVGMRIDL